MKKKLIIISIFIIFIISLLFLNTSNNNKIDDYYTYINNDTLNNVTLADDDLVWSVFNDYQDKIDDEVLDITKSMLNKNDNMRVIYNQFLDETSRNKEGINYFKKYFNNIDNSKNMSELLNNIYDIEHDLNIDILMNFQISKDFKDSTKNILYLMPITFDFSNSLTIYSDENYSYYEAVSKKYQIRLLETFGYSKKEARSISDKINEMQNDIASHSNKTEYYNSVDAYYNISNRSELKNIYSNIDIDKYFKIKGFNNIETFSLVDKGSYQTFNSYLISDNLDLFKIYFKLIILENYIDGLSDEYVKIYNDYSNELSGITEEYDINESALNLVSSLYSDIIEKEYSINNTELEKVDYINNMIKDIVEYYKSDINSIDWLSDSTKKSAIKKLENINVNIGLQDNAFIYSDGYNINENDSLLENINSINSHIYSKKLEILNNNITISSIPQTTFNAYYNPQDNSINFPVSFFELVDLDKSYYENLGNVGMVIAHEITHAFDNNGALFDEKGNYTNWWSEKDLNEFKNRSKAIIEYYNQYELEGISIDGEKTLSENIADLGSINCITNVAISKNATNEELKKMYESYAKLWAIKYNKSYLKLLLSTDTHSPNSVRVNATLSLCDKFNEIYNITKNDMMYKKEKVGIW